MATRMTTLVLVLLTGVVGRELDYELEDDWEDISDEEEIPSWYEHYGISTWWSAGESDALCPPPVLHDINPEACDRPQCDNDVECETETESSGVGDNRTNSQHACCYNGCVHTCTPKLDPPIAIDWLEEFRTNIEGLVDLEEEMSARQHQESRAVPEVIALPGGCILTMKQFYELESFRKHCHVNKCFCDKGEVLCDVSQR